MSNNYGNCNSMSANLAFSSGLIGKLKKNSGLSSSTLTHHEKDDFCFKRPTPVSQAKKCIKLNFELTGVTPYLEDTISIFKSALTAANNRLLNTSEDLLLALYVNFTNLSMELLRMDTEKTINESALLRNDISANVDWSMRSNNRSVNVGSQFRPPPRAFGNVETSQMSMQSALGYGDFNGSTLNANPNVDWPLSLRLNNMNPGNNFRPLSRAFENPETSHMRIQSGSGYDFNGRQAGGTNGGPMEFVNFQTRKCNVILERLQDNYVVNNNVSPIQNGTRIEKSDSIFKESLFHNYNKSIHVKSDGNITSNSMLESQKQSPFTRKKLRRDATKKSITFKTHSKPDLDHTGCNELLKWYIIKKPDSKSVELFGCLRLSGNVTTIMSHGIVISRIASCTIKTSKGTYQLIGPIHRKNADISMDICKKFRNGFPLFWRKALSH